MSRTIRHQKSDTRTAQADRINKLREVRVRRTPHRDMELMRERAFASLYGRVGAR